jgi:ribosomal protein S18 acetylase RimI-like enzyme
MDLRLRPLRDDELPDFIERGKREYTRTLVDEAGLPPERAAAKTESDYASLFPAGARQPNQRISVLEDADSGETVGQLFWAERQPPDGGGPRCYLYDIEIDERFRGRGLGRRAMQLLEEEARTVGLPGIDLNVWGGNDVARSLYRSLGFIERGVFMSKELA